MWFRERKRYSRWSISQTKSWNVVVDESTLQFWNCNRHGSVISILRLIFRFTTPNWFFLSGLKLKHDSFCMFFYSFCVRVRWLGKQGACAHTEIYMAVFFVVFWAACVFRHVRVCVCRNGCQYGCACVVSSLSDLFKSFVLCVQNKLV